MYRTYTVDIPTESHKIIQSSSSGVTYIYYTMSSGYNSELKKNRPVRKLIGKKDVNDPKKMYPNDAYYSVFTDEKAPEECDLKNGRCSRMNIGSFLVFQNLVNKTKLVNCLKPIMGDETGFFLDLVFYILESQNNVMQFYEDYAWNHPVMTTKQKIYSDSTISNFIWKIGAKAWDVDFLNRWNDGRDPRQKIYVSYDSTNKTCQAGDIDLAEPTKHNKPGELSRVINLAIVYDQTNDVPLFYHLYDGSVVDTQQLKIIVDKANAMGYTNITIVLDRGYYSADNIRYLEEHGINYIIMAKGLKSWVQALILDNFGKFEHDATHRIFEKGVNGTTIYNEVLHIDNNLRCCHLFYSTELNTSEAKKIDAEVNKRRKELKKVELVRGAKINDDRYADYFNLIYADDETTGESYLLDFVENNDTLSIMYKLCGYFVLITSEEMSAKKALLTYKERDEIEKLFSEDKRFARSERVHSTEAARGKMLIEFVALIIYSKFREILAKALMDSDSHPNYLTYTAAEKELDKIAMTIGTNGKYKLESALSRKQKEILGLFDMTENEVRNHADKLSSIYARKPAGSLLNLV
ncbi:MAG: transposase [Clostridia bacterium]|nr:transposase [Clostridia bacterium]